MPRFLALLLVSSTSQALAEHRPEREAGDYNFDGYPDYRVMREQPGNQCGWFDYYLYDPAIRKHRFVETAFCKEQFDEARKLVTTRVSGGMAGLIYMIRRFRWDGFTVVPVSAEHQDYDPERRLFIRAYLSNLDQPGGPSVSTEILTAAELGVDEADLPR